MTSWPSIKNESGIRCVGSQHVIGELMKCHFRFEQKGIHGSIVSILGLLFRISSPLSLFYFVYRVLWAHFTSSFHANYRIIIQWSAPLLDYYPMECSTSWFDFIALCLRMSQIWVPIPSGHSNSHYKKAVVSSTIPAHTEHNGHMHQWDMDV